MRLFEEAVASDLEELLRAGVPTRGVRLTVREIVVARLGQGVLGASEVTATVEAVVRAAGRMVRERGAEDELVEAACRAALEAVRGHGGESARWLAEATTAMSVVFDELAQEYHDERAWHWLLRRLERW